MNVNSDLTIAHEARMSRPRNEVFRRQSVSSVKDENVQNPLKVSVRIVISDW